jgi:hypothetical protein|tara:strand:+ start:729 stop:956 length:228 start_codon:yes stop_codon:yes gene_type:complete
VAGVLVSSSNKTPSKELDGYLKEAESLVADLPAEQQRFKDRITHQRHGFELARQRSDLRDTMHGAPPKVVSASRT